jgi:hypothetical protein
MSARIAWSWRSAAYGVALAAPGMIAALFDPVAGLGLAVGSLPAAAVGLRGDRRARAMVLVVGCVAGLALMAGSTVAPWPLIAVPLVLVLCVTAALATTVRPGRIAPLVLMLGVPMYGAGLSIGESSGTGAGLLIIVGSAYGWLVSLPWRSWPAATPARARTTRSAMLVYGVQIGLAGAVAAAVGFALGADHPGWACTAALLVSRPERRQLDARGWGRAASVTLGAIFACVVALAAPGPVGIAAVILAVLAVGAATAGSGWYVFPFFSTALVLSLLLADQDETPAHWFVERVGMTLVGVALAVAAAAVIPRLASSRGKARQTGV